MDHHHKTDRTLDQIRLCCRALDDKKAEGLKVLHVEGISPITDYLILATGTSEPHLKALSSELEKTMKDAKVHISGFEKSPQSGWMIMDGFDFMVHLFTHEMRDLYRLDSLWKDAEEISVDLEAVSA